MKNLGFMGTKGRDEKQEMDEKISGGRRDGKIGGGRNGRIDEKLLLMFGGCYMAVTYRTDRKLGVFSSKGQS